MSRSRLRPTLLTAYLLATLSIAASHAVAQQTRKSPPPLGISNLPASLHSYASETAEVVKAHRTELEELRKQQQR